MGGRVICSGVCMDCCVPTAAATAGRLCFGGSLEAGPAGIHRDFVHAEIANADGRHTVCVKAFLDAEHGAPEIAMDAAPGAA